MTQFSLAAEFAARGMEPPRLGDSYETDLILNGAASELIADAFFEAIFVIGWRVIRCKTDIPPDDPWLRTRGRRRFVVTDGIATRGY